MGVQVAAAVAEEAFKQNLAGVERPTEGLLEYMKGRMWHPQKEQPQAKM